MPACARAEIVREGEVAVYHVYTRCVRRAFLCGDDPLTGRNYDYRRDWIRDMEEQLAGLFGLDVSFHCELANHLHLILRSRPDVVTTWTDQDVARRWLVVSRLIHSKNGRSIRPVTDEDVARELAEPERVAELRKRLASVSQFMKALCEHTARRANAEDGVRGAFFEERFGCKSLEGESAILLCGIYIDLNQIRAGEALTPEESTHTSAHDRIQGLLQREQQVAGGRSEAPSASSPDAWLSPLTVDGRASAYRGADPSQSGRRASDMGILPITLSDYLQLLDWTGRRVAEGKRGSIPAELAPILDRLGVNKLKWLDLVSRFETLFSHIVGTSAQLAQRAAKAGRRWYRGGPQCAEAFG